MEKQPYKLLKSGSLEGLEQKEIDAMELQGYIPQGGVAFFGSGGDLYLQAMVLPK